MKYLVTGAAGFIGSHLVEAFMRDGDTVVGIDNMNDHYDVARKEANLAELEALDVPGKLEFHRGDILDRELLDSLFHRQRFDAIVHLAAMAGVRNSIDHPALYWRVNLEGTRNLLEAMVATNHPDNRNFVFASTSSVYGATEQIPFVETDPCNAPLVPYSASKRAAEVMGYSYHHLYKVNFTGVRFFTVYGPRGRPDMMAFKVLDSIYSGETVPLNNGGEMYRDWTFVSDTVAGVVAAARNPQAYELINLGRGEPVKLSDFVAMIEKKMGKQAHFEDARIPVGDIPLTHADISKARRLLGYNPTVSVEEGVDRFVEWYQSAVAD
ncbi:MAG: GDP-mannose 4,6-dehydratase [Actinomycetota bacterium]